MVVPMKKVSLVVMNKDREESLRLLRRFGVIHLENKSVSSEALTKLLERKTRVENAMGVLRPYTAVKKPEAPAEETGTRNRRASDMNSSVPYTSDAVNDPVRSDLVTQVMEYADQRKALQDQVSVLARERSRIEEWGNFDPKGIASLADQNINLFLYKSSLKDFEALEKDFEYIILGTDKNSVRFLVLDKMLPGESPFALPENSLTEIDSTLAEIHDELAEIERQLGILAGGKVRVERELKVLLGRIEFESARAGMDVLSDDGGEASVAWITGFVPQEDLGLLKRGAAENGWALAADDPGPEDKVPTKLKNNRLVSLLNPLTGFLEVTPGYDEPDISGWFLLFFVIFFGMIFGDAGYGAILLIAAIIGIIKTAKKGTPPVIMLLLLLAGSNFVWGILTCTWFGVEAEKLPAFLQQISLPLISNAVAARSPADEGIVRQNLMIFCFSLALIQLSIGHIIAITRCRTLKILGELGTIAMLLGMYGVVLSLIASNEYRQIPLLMPCVYLLGAGFVLNFIFTNYDGSIGKSIVDSLKNIISMILGIANVFSDIMSYIRLWAVGLAGGAISSTVDAMAGPMLGHFIFFIFGIILLVFGHGLNLVLNVLSVLVHGVRLNTLEFSGHVGLTWAGTAYKPFSEAGIPPSRETSGRGGSNK